MKYFQKPEIEIRKIRKWAWLALVDLKRGLGDQTSNFDPIVENTVIYRLYVIQNIEVKINYRNTVAIKNELYENYRFCPGN